MRGRQLMLAGLVALGVLPMIPALIATPASATTAIPGAFVSLPQRELLDSQTGFGVRRAKIHAHSTLIVQLLGRAGIPTSGVSSARLNVSAFDTPGAGSLVIAGEPIATFARSGLVTNSVIVRPDSHGRFAITNTSAGAIDVSASALGYYRSGTVTQAGMFRPTPFAHLLNPTVLGSGRTLTIAVAGRALVPSGGASAVALNLSGFNATTRGTAFVFAGPLGASATPELSYRPGIASRVFVTVPISPDGTIKVLNRGPGAVDLSATVEGFYRPGIPLAAGALVNHEAVAGQDSPVTVGPGRTVTGVAQSHNGEDPSGLFQVGVYVAHPSQSGSLSVWTNGATRPSVPTLVFTAGSPGFLEIPLRTSAYLVSLHNYSRAPIQVTLDEGGLFSNGQVGAITGTVTDSGGHPLPGVRVTVGDNYSASQFQINPAVFVTGADGRYQIAGLSAGSYAVCFDPSSVSHALSSTGFQPRCYNSETQSPDYVIVSADQVASGINQAMPVGAAVIGHVTDTGGHPLGGISLQATVSSGPWETVTVTTKADGSFRFDGLDANSWYYTVCSVTGLSASRGSAPAGYVGSCNTSPTRVTPVAGTATDVGTIAMYPAVGVSGTVTDASGHPLMNVGVGVGVGTSGYNQPWAWTDSHGHYVITGIDPMAPPNTSPVYVCFEVNYAYPRRVTGGSSTTGYVGQCYKNLVPNPKYSAPSSTPIHPASGTIATHIDGHLPAAAAITGTVTNAAGHPLSGITVQVSTDDLNRTTVWQTTTTGANGTYRIDSLQPGTYNVCFVPTPGDPHPSGYIAQCWRNLPAPPRGPENITLSSGQTLTHINAALNAGGQISGVITDKAGHGLQGVNVFIDWNNLATTDATGHYSVRYVQPGTHSVCFEASSATGGTSTTGYLNQCWKNQPYGGTWTGVVVTVGHTSTISAALAALGGIAVHVTDTLGHPLSGAPISVFVGDQSSNGTTYSGTGSDGTETVTRLTDGQYTVCVKDTSGISGGSSTTGYQAQCYGQTTSTPSTPITISGGDTVPITIALPAN